MTYVSMAGQDGLWWTSNYDPNAVNDPNKTNMGFKVKLQLTKEVVAPAYKDAVDAFLDTVKDTSIRELTESVYGKREDQRSQFFKKEYDKNVKNFMSDMMNRSVSECLDSAFLEYSKSLMRSENNRKAFFNKLESMGYNAVVDYNDASTKNGNPGPEAPLIIFERAGTTKQISATPITWKDQEAIDMLLLEKKKS